MNCITDAEFQSIGFNLVRVTAGIRKYIYLQYYLRYDPVTCKVIVTYGRDQVTYDVTYASLVNGIAQLTSDLVRNGVIVAPAAVSC